MRSPRFAMQLEREAIRLSRIVADLLDLSRLESGSALDDLVSLGAATREEAQRLEEAAREAGVALEIETSRERPIRGSQRDLALLVRNLVDNAIRYSHEGSEVRVEIACEDDDVTLRVSDTGIGIPSKDIPRIFERFYRVDRARSRETGGTGLGLAIVKHVVENHGGTMEVDSELGRGTTFEISVPGRATPRRAGRSSGPDRAFPSQSAAICDRRGGGSGAGTIESLAPNAPRKRSRIVLGRQPAGTGP